MKINNNREFGGREEYHNIVKILGSTVEEGDIACIVFSEADNKSFTNAIDKVLIW